jgi:hypothetical protein
MARLQPLKSHPKFQGKENLKENQGEMGLYKRREVNPSRGEKPEIKS